MNSKDIIEAAEQKKPVIYECAVYPRILEYILWFDDAGARNYSVTLLDKNGVTKVRVPANKISLAEVSR